MSDTDLVDLVTRAALEELTPEQCAAIRAAAQKSPEVQRACRERIGLEEQLAATLGRPQVSVDELLAGRRRITDERGRGPWLALALLGLLVAGLGTLLVSRWKPEPDEEQVAVVEADIPAATPAANPDVVDAPAATPAEPPAAEPPPPPPSAPVAVEPPAALPDTPWAKALAADAPEPAAADLFRWIQPRGSIDRKELETWFTPLPGPPVKIGVKGLTGSRTVTAMEGRFRLAPPLREGTALRLLLHMPSGLRIVAWSGKQGAVIETQADSTAPAPRWCGSVLSRPAPDKPADGRWLASTSDGRGAFSGAGWQDGSIDFTGIVELRYVGGALLLSRGEVRLVEVPLPAQPDEIVFEGTMMIAGIELVRAVDPPPLPEPPPATTAWRPADLEWEGTSGAALEKRADGSVRLSQTEAAPKAPLIASWKLPPPEFGPQEIVLRLDDCTPGTGILLAGPEGATPLVCGFVDVQPGGPPAPKGLHFMVWPPTKSPLTGGNPKNPGPACAPRPVWLRLGVVFGSVVVSWSGDGKNWARLREYPAWRGPGGIASIGLFVGGHPGLGITLTHLGVAELPGFAKLLPRDLVPAVDAKLVTETDAKRFGPWRDAMLAAKPAEVDEGRWLAAAAIRGLATTRVNFTTALCMLAWQHSMTLDLPLDERLAVCDDVCRMADVLPSEIHVLGAGTYGAVAHACVERGDVAGFRTCWRRLRQAPGDVGRVIPYDQLVDPLRVADRLVRRLVVDDPGGDLRGVLSELRFYANGGGLAAGMSRQLEVGNALVLETRNRLSTSAADFRAAIAAEAWEDAHRVLGRYADDAGGGEPDRGIVQDAADPDRFATLPLLAQGVTAEQPAFRQFLLGDPAARGQLRVTQLRAAGDHRGMAAAAIEFQGTPAGADAHEWLAMRALAAGDFTGAREHARTAIAWAPGDARERLQTIRAMADGLQGIPVTAAPKAGLAGAPAAEIAALVTVDKGGARPASAAALTPGQLETVKRADLGPANQGTPAVDYPGSAGPPVEARFLPLFQTPPFVMHRLDWSAEVCAIVATPNRLLATNRVELVSLDPATGAVQWRSPPGPKPGVITQYGLVPMRPAWDDQQAYVRRLAHGGNPTLVAIRLTDGTIAWESPPTAAVWPISDPVLVGGGLRSFAIRGGFVDQLVFVALDPATGDVLFERPVCGLLPEWRVPRPARGSGHLDPGDCPVAVADGRLFVTIGGCVACCQADGHVRWLRRLPWAAAGTDAWWSFQAQQPPLVQGGTVYVMQPGFHGIAAIDADDGRLRWKTALPLARRLVGMAGAGDAARLVAETGDGLVAIDPRDGISRLILDGRDDAGGGWLGIRPTRLIGAAATTGDGLAIVPVQQRRPDTDKTGMLDAVLLWVDVVSGAVRHATPLPALAGKPPWLGPVTVAEGRLWLLAAPEGQAEPRDLRRAVWELAPQPAP
jgi:outer membrane protein assembly factor BamB